MITEGRYKDRRAITVQSRDLRAVILPDDGAKMASLVRLCDNRELLAVKGGDTYKVLTSDGSYVDSECSAFDDMFPTIDPYTPKAGAYAGITYPDHGEICRLPFAVTLQENAAVFTVHSGLFPITYQKTVCPAEDGGINVSYTIQNRGGEPFPYVWAGHIMLQGEDGMRLLTPFRNSAPTEMMFMPGDCSPDQLPKDHLTGYKPGVGAAYKFYYLDKTDDGCFSVRYRDGRALLFAYDKEKLPYLGIWLNNGEFQDMYSIAPEPCTVPFDAPHKAAERGYTSVIPAKGEFSFIIHIYVKNT